MILTVRQVLNLYRRFEMPVTLHQSTRRHTPEDLILQRHLKIPFPISMFIALHFTLPYACYPYVTCALLLTL